MGVLSKALSFFRGADRGLEKARREEARGNLEHAIALYLQAGARQEAARLHLARADSAVEPLARYQLLGQALALAAGETRHPVVRRRGELALELFRQGSLVLTRSEHLRFAADLEGSGCPTLAAEFYELGGDLDSRTRALVEAGAIDRLERVLSKEAERERSARQHEAELQKISDLNACGRRREALALARALEEADERVRTLANRIEARRTRGASYQLSVAGEQIEVSFESPATIGRADATVVIKSPSVSRQHLVVRPTERGPEVADLGSRNGTTLRGVRLDVPLLVGEQLELVMGGDVEVRLSSRPDGAVCLETSARRVLLPLGPLQLDSMVLRRADDGWLELEAESAVYVEGLRLDQRAQLCVGDKVTTEATGTPAVEVLA